MPILGGCLCFDLPTGSKIIGGLYLFCALMNTLFLAITNLILWAMNMIPQLIEFLEKAMKEQEGNFQAMHHDGHDGHDDEDHLIHIQDSNDTREAEETLKETMRMIRENVYLLKVCFLVLLCLAILSVITSSMLIHGIRKNRRGLLMPWILQEVIHIVVAIAFVIVIFIVFGGLKISFSIAMPIIIGTFFQVFFIVVVISQFQALGLIRMHDEMCMK